MKKFVLCFVVSGVLFSAAFVRCTKIDEDSGGFEKVVERGLTVEQARAFLEEFMIHPATRSASTAPSGFTAGNFTTQWSTAVATYDDWRIESVDAKITPDYIYLGRFASDPADTTAGWYESLITQKLVVVQERGAPAKNAYIMNLVPSEDYKAFHGEDMSGLFNNGRLSQDFTGLVFYTRIIDGKIVRADRYHNGKTTLRASVFDQGLDSRTIVANILEVISPAHIYRIPIQAATRSSAPGKCNGCGQEMYRSENGTGIYWMCDNADCARIPVYIWLIDAVYCTPDSNSGGGPPSDAPPGQQPPGGGSGTDYGSGSGGNSGGGSSGSGTGSGYGSGTGSGSSSGSDGGNWGGGSDGGGGSGWGNGSGSGGDSWGGGEDGGDWNGWGNGGVDGGSGGGGNWDGSSGGSFGGSDGTGDGNGTGGDHNFVSEEQIDPGIGGGGGGNGQKPGLILDYGRPRSTDIFRDSLKKEQRDSVDRLLSNLYDDCMGKNLLNWIRFKIGNGRFNLVYNPESTPWFGGPKPITLNLNSLSDIYNFMHEMFHIGQSYMELTDDWNNSAAQIEIECQIATLLYLRRMPDSPEKRRRMKIIENDPLWNNSLTFMGHLDNNGRLLPTISRSDFESAFMTFSRILSQKDSNYPFDENRSDLNANMKTILKLFKDC